MQSLKNISDTNSLLQYCCTVSANSKCLSCSVKLCSCLETDFVNNTKMDPKQFVCRVCPVEGKWGQTKQYKTLSSPSLRVYQFEELTI